MNVSNVLSEEKKKQVIALGQLGWTLRRIEKETGIRRETAAGYLKAAGISVRSSGRWGHPTASEVTTDPGFANPSNGDATNSAPVEDRLLFDLFTTAFNDNATRGQLSVNISSNSLAAWSAVNGNAV